MLQFVFLAVLVSRFMPNHSFGLSLISSGGGDGGSGGSISEDPSSRLFLGICSSLCERRTLYLESFQIAVRPPIICGICRRKGITTTTTTTTTTTPKPKTTLAPSTEAAPSTASTTQAAKTVPPSAGPTTQAAKRISSSADSSTQAGTTTDDGETTAPSA